MRIDSHHHFWNYSAEAYGWISDSMGVLKRDFRPADLKGNLDAARIAGVVSVQARAEEAENDLLLGYANAHSWILGVVGWLDLTAKEIGEKVAHFAEHPKAVALREVLQGLKDREYCLRDDFNRGLATLHAHGLAYDLLIYEDQLRAAAQCVDRHPVQIFVLDHIAKPRIGDSGGVSPTWADEMHDLARRENVFCKLSGMITELMPDISNWTPELMRPWFDVALDAFGPNRLLFGSDWPVCLLRGSYVAWVQCVESWIKELSLDEQAAIFGANAQRAYGLNVR